MSEDSFNPTYEEIIEEIRGINPTVVELAYLRVRNRKLEGAVSEETEDGV